MKKSTLLLLVAGGFCSALVAQPVLTSAGIMPVVGSSYTSVTSAYASPGNSGANQTWNLALTNNGTGTATGVTPSSTPYAASFPGATVAFNSGAYAYYKGTSSAWQNCGYVSGSTVISYSNLEDMLHFPFTYNDTYTDTWSATFVSASYTYYRTGTTTVTGWIRNAYYARWNIFECDTCSFCAGLPGFHKHCQHTVCYHLLQR
jgi:hypothetical protein